MNSEQIAARVAQGRLDAENRSATEPKSFGQTSPVNYPYTYWWIKGYNDWVEENQG